MTVNVYDEDVIINMQMYSCPDISNKYLRLDPSIDADMAMEYKCKQYELQTKVYTLKNQPKPAKFTKNLYEGCQEGFDKNRYNKILKAINDGKCTRINFIGGKVNTHSIRGSARCGLYYNLETKELVGVRHYNFLIPSMQYPKYTQPCIQNAKQNLKARYPKINFSDSNRLNTDEFLKNTEDLY